MDLYGIKDQGVLKDAEEMWMPKMLKEYYKKYLEIKPEDENI